VARLADRLPQNVEGPFYVDSTCIDCDTCRFVAPRTFSRDDSVEQSVVSVQPASDEEVRRAAMALVACPTSSIGVTGDASVTAHVKDASRAFPEPITDSVSYCGYASEDSFGASSWLIARPPERGGNVLVDSPRAAKPLMARLRELGGVRTMFLTHRDDVADHARFREAFDCVRVMHRADVGTSTRDVEQVVEGDAPIVLDEELTVIPLPGHTRGSAGLLYRAFGKGHLFTGDHLWWSAERAALHASRSVSWYSWEQQTRSMERLLEHDFEWIFPGHGRRFHAASADDMRRALHTLIAWMRQRR
jgi:glyoxylase-like metal-dependent hydrolase (beta-lactamase superfamily II)/ferredoxin